MAAAGNTVLLLNNNAFQDAVSRNEAIHSIQTLFENNANSRVSQNYIDQIYQALDEGGKDLRESFDKLWAEHKKFYHIDDKDGRSRNKGFKEVVKKFLDENKEHLKKLYISPKKNKQPNPQIQPGKQPPQIQPQQPQIYAEAASYEEPSSSSLLADAVNLGQTVSATSSYSIYDSITDISARYIENEPGINMIEPQVREEAYNRLNNLEQQPGGHIPLNNPYSFASIINSVKYYASPMEMKRRIFDQNNNPFVRLINTLALMGIAYGCYHIYASVVKPAVQSIYRSAVQPATQSQSEGYGLVPYTPVNNHEIELNTEQINGLRMAFYYLRDGGVIILVNNRTGEVTIPVSIAESFPSANNNDKDEAEEETEQTGLVSTISPTIPPMPSPSPSPSPPPGGDPSGPIDGDNKRKKKVKKEEYEEDQIYISTNQIVFGIGATIVGLIVFNPLLSSGTALVALTYYKPEVVVTILKWLFSFLYNILYETGKNVLYISYELLKVVPPQIYVLLIAAYGAYAAYTNTRIFLFDKTVQILEKSLKYLVPDDDDDKLTKPKKRKY